MSETMPLLYQVVPYVFMLLSAGTAVAAFMKLSTTPAGVLIGGGMTGHLLISLGLRVLRQVTSGDEVLALSLGSSWLHLLMGTAVAIGLFLLPDSLKRRSAPEVAHSS